MTLCCCTRLPPSLPAAQGGVPADTRGAEAAVPSVQGAAHHGEGGGTSHTCTSHTCRCHLPPQPTGATRAVPCLLCHQLPVHAPDHRSTPPLPPSRPCCSCTMRWPSTSTSPPPAATSRRRRPPRWASARSGQPAQTPSRWAAGGGERMPDVPSSWAVAGCCLTQWQGAASVLLTVNRPAAAPPRRS